MINSATLSISIYWEVKLGKRGIEQVIELELTPDEKAALTSSAEAVRELVKAMK